MSIYSTEALAIAASKATSAPFMVAVFTGPASGSPATARVVYVVDAVADLAIADAIVTMSERSTVWVPCAGGTWRKLTR